MTSNELPRIRRKQQSEPSRIVIDIRDVGKAYWEKVILPFAPYIQDDRAYTKSKQIYQESIRQIFDCMDSDLNVFFNQASLLPKINLFIGHEVLALNDYFKNLFNQEIKEFSVGIYFALREMNILSPDTDIILDHPGHDYVTVIVVPKDYNS